jgi:diacylglycerol kinase family enzyme
VSLRDGKYAFRGTRVNAEFAFDRVDRDVSPTMIEAGTRPYYGNMFKVCPDVVCNDGNMDVYMFNFRKKSAVLTNVSDLWRGNHEHINRRLTHRDGGVIERYELHELSISAAEPFPFHIDGELMEAATDENGLYRVTVRVLPRRLRFIVPGRFHRLFHPFEEESEHGRTTGCRQQ